jgi:hypothetical protein
MSRLARQIPDGIGQARDDDEEEITKSAQPSFDAGSETLRLRCCAHMHKAQVAEKMAVCLCKGRTSAAAHFPVRVSKSMRAT